MASKIAVIIPVLNAKPYLERNLHTLLSQDLPFDELVYIDNGSTDGSLPLLRALTHGDERVKIVNCVQKGRGAPRNVGINSSSAEIIVCSDADCYYPSDWLRTLVKPLLSSRAWSTQGAEQSATNHPCARFIQEENAALLKRSIQKTSTDPVINHIDTKNFAILRSKLPEPPFDPDLDSLVDFDFYLRLGISARPQFVPGAIVYHFHKSSALALFCLQLRRGYWLAQIFRKHRGDKELVGRTAMFRSLGLRNNLVWPAWYLSFLWNRWNQARNGCVRYGAYKLISELGWRLGALLGLL